MDTKYKVQNLKEAYNHLLFVNSGVTEIFLLETGIKFINTNGVFEHINIGDTVIYNSKTKVMVKE